MALPVAAEGDGSQIIDDARLSAIFGIELGEDITTTPPAKTEPTGKHRDEVEFCSETPDSSESSLSPELTGEFVARLREELELSVSEFAEAIGVSGASVRRWESTRGRLRLKARCLEALVALREKAKPTMD